MLPPSASDIVLLLDACVAHFDVNDVRLPLWASVFNSEQGRPPQDWIFYYAAPVVIDPSWRPGRTSAERSQAALTTSQESDRPRKRACSVEDLCLGGYHKASLHLIFDPSVVRSKALAALLASVPPDQAPHIKETNLRPLPVERLEFALEHALPLEQLGMRCCSAGVPEFSPNRRVSLDVLAPNYKMASEMAQAFERVAIVYMMTFSALKISASIMTEALKLAKEEALKRVQQLHQKQIFVHMSQYLESPPLKGLFASYVSSAVSGLDWSVRDGDAVVFLAQLKMATSDFRRCVVEPFLDEFYSSCDSAGRSQAATVSDASSKVEQLALKLVLSKSERVRLWPVVSDPSALTQRNCVFPSLSHSESRFLNGGKYLIQCSSSRAYLDPSCSERERSADHARAEQSVRKDDDRFLSLLFVRSAQLGRMASVGMLYRALSIGARRSRVEQNVDERGAVHLAAGTMRLGRGVRGYVDRRCADGHGGPCPHQAARSN